MGELVKVGTVDDFREGRGTVVRLGDTKVAVFKIGGRLQAIQDSCPHMGASLGDSQVRDGKVFCHWHGWSFDLKTGQGSLASKSWLCARIYEVTVENREVFLRRPEALPEKQEEEWTEWDPKFLKKKEKEGTD
jgi:nitrite reductase/ring-hydroxylating ferredoxin subunit